MIMLDVGELWMKEWRPITSEVLRDHAQLHDRCFYCL
jgi:hypothetical protein